MAQQQEEDFFEAVAGRVVRRLANDPSLDRNAQVSNWHLPALEDSDLLKVGEFFQLNHCTDAQLEIFRQALRHLGH